MKETFTLDEAIQVAEEAVKRERITAKRAFSALWARSTHLTTDSLRWLMEHPAYFHPMFRPDKITGTLNEKDGEEILSELFGVRGT